MFPGGGVDKPEAFALKVELKKIRYLFVILVQQNRSARDQAVSRPDFSSIGRNC
jgi:hypothetical protein